MAVVLLAYPFVSKMAVRLLAYPFASKMAVRLLVYPFVSMAAASMLNLASLELLADDNGPMLLPLRKLPSRQDRRNWGCDHPHQAYSLPS
jgi:hypothetical protein